MNLEDIKKYLTIKKTEFDTNIFDVLKLLKERAIAEENEIDANEIWCFEAISKIQKMYLNVFYLLKEGKYDNYFNAWLQIEQIGIELTFLRDNYDYRNNKFYLDFIEKVIKEYEKLFPYQFF